MTLYSSSHTNQIQEWSQAIQHEGAFLLNNLRKLSHSVGRSRWFTSGVPALAKGNPRFSITFLLVGIIFLGAGFPGCVAAPKAPETEELMVSFVFTGHHESVCLSGDFNGWSSESHCLERKGDEWSIQLVLPPGSYRYVFVINKRDWVCDPEALIKEDDGFGRKNSVLLIDPHVTKRPSGP